MLAILLPPDILSFWPSIASAARLRFCPLYPQTPSPPGFTLLVMILAPLLAISSPSATAFSSSRIPDLPFLPTSPLPLIRSPAFFDSSTVCSYVGITVLQMS
ncbi:hypothetical protein ACEPAI_5918 [Sanghuangporus weigelae]